MDRKTVVQILLTHRVELEQLGVKSLSVFGSTSRGEQTPQSDVDLAITLDSEMTAKGLAAIGRLTLIETKLHQALGAPIDVVPEPARKPAVQAAMSGTGFVFTEAAKHQRWLLDIVENIDKVNAYVAGMTLREFEAHAMAVDAVERCMMRITEVAFRLEGKVEAWMPQQEWQNMRALGNLLQHRYDTVRSASFGKL